jgi:hypothetical protein
MPLSLIKIDAIPSKENISSLVIRKEAITPS